jgi:hypothetical protein
MPLWLRRARRQLAWIVRHTLSAKVGALRCAPERSWAGLRGRMRRMAGTDSGMRPPRHGHVAAIDRMESTLGMAPIEAIRAVRTNRLRAGGDSFAAPLPAARLRPVGGFFGLDRCLRRIPSADSFVLPKPAPKSAGGAIGWSGRLITHWPLPRLRTYSARYVAKPSFARGSGGADQPPPRASIRPMTATCWRMQRDGQTLCIQRGALGRPTFQRTPSGPRFRYRVAAIAAGSTARSGGMVAPGCQPPPSAL